MTCFDWRLLIGVREAARRLGVHENTVRNWADSGFLHTATQHPESRYRKFTENEITRVQGILADGNGRSLQDEAMPGAVAGILVRIRLPPGMSPAQAVREIARSVGFGRPEVSLRYVIAAGKPEDPGKGGAEDNGAPGLDV